MMVPAPAQRTHVQSIDTSTGLARITVCTRPFRAAGPRIEAERIGDATILHNYGHGGSGWSLSWGSAAEVLELLRELPDTPREVAVIGAGALGLTAGLTLQRAGLLVTLYAREWPPETRSSHATGSWTPDSRIALSSCVDDSFAARWERMTRTSFAAFAPYIARPEAPVEWTPRYVLSDSESDPFRAAFVRQDTHGFFHRISLLHGMTPALQPMAASPFGTRYAWHTRSLTFNIGIYAELLLEEFRRDGGTTATRDFHRPTELAALPQRVVVHCTGYAARALFGDTSVTPVRGQIGWLDAQPGVNYGLLYGNLNVLARRDGIVVQPSPQGENTGWDDASEVPDSATAEDGLRQLAALQARSLQHQPAGRP